MTNAHAKSFTASRRSILKGLGAAAIGISLVDKKSSAWAKEEPKLNFYNWDTYIGETTLPDFTKATGIDVGLLINFGTRSLDVRRKYRMPLPSSSESLEID